MAYARLGPNSDVYVFESVTGYECCVCHLSNNGWTYTATPEEMVAHLHAHRKAGDRVPEDALQRLSGTQDD